jgi:hypothetical protein
MYVKWRVGCAVDARARCGVPINAVPPLDSRSSPDADADADAPRSRQQRKRDRRRRLRSPSFSTQSSLYSLVISLRTAID